VRSAYAIHILTGTLGLLGGYVALYSAKGGAVHRRSGMLFVYAMLVMAVAGMTIAVVRDKAPDINLPAGLITSYMVITSLITVRPPAVESDGRRWLDVGAMLVALGVGTTMLVFGIEAIANGGKRNGFPAFPYFLFATFGLLGAAGDLRMLRTGALQGRPRLARHLWRMSVALFIAALSFSVQLAKFIPKPYRIQGLLMLPVLAVVVTMFYWLWRVRARRSRLRVVVVRAAEAVQ
jgi:multisubunit Na+/H+ antiporter MnhB subunit